MQQSAWPSALNWDPAAAGRLGEMHRVLATLSGAPSALVVTGRDARASGWAGAATIALADRVAAARGCVLLDLTFDGGELHERLGIDSVEGVADIFLYGASLGHVTHRPAGHNFEFAPAGLPADAELVLTHRRWHRLLGEILNSGLQLLAYSPADAPGLAELARRIPRVIVLAAPEEVAPIAARLGNTVECLAVLSPPAPPAEGLDLGPSRFEPGAAYQPPFAETGGGIATLPPDSETPPETPGRRSDQEFESIRVPRKAAREALIADLRARQRSALKSAPAGPPIGDLPAPPVTGFGAPPVDRRRMPAAQTGTVLTEPGFVSAERPVRARSRRGLYLTVLISTLTALAIAAWFANKLYQRARSVVEPALPTAVVPAPVVPSRIVPLPYSVAVEAHPDLQIAGERVAALRAEEPDLGFYVAPVRIDTMIYYRVMAGPVADSVEASVLLRRLLEKGHKTGATQWDVRRAPLAFVLGEFSDRTAAQAREYEVAGLSVPAYVIEVQGLDGDIRYRVYAGAYSGIAEAETLRRMLRAAALPDSLVQRVGVRR